MTVASPLPANDRRPAIDSTQSSLQSRLVAALDRRRVGEFTTHATAADSGQSSAWIAFDASGPSRCHIAPILADGAIAHVTDAAGRPDAAAAALVLGPIEPLIAAIELVLGHALLPTAVVDAPSPGATVVRIDAIADGHPRHRVLLAVAGGEAIASAADLPLDQRALPEIAPAWSATMAGPMLRGASLAGMSDGDLLLLGIAPCLVTLRPSDGAAKLIGVLDVAAGTVTIEQVLGRDEAIDTERATSVADGADIATSIEFACGGLTTERLAALDVGSVVPLPGAGGGVLPVTVHAGGSLVARGQLVAIGDGHGVLLTDVLQSSPGG